MIVFACPTRLHLHRFGEKRLFVVWSGVLVHGKVYIRDNDDLSVTSYFQRLHPSLDVSHIKLSPSNYKPIIQVSTFVKMEYTKIEMLPNVYTRRYTKIQIPFHRGHFQLIIISPDFCSTQECHGIYSIIVSSLL